MALPTYDALVSPLLLLLARQAGARKLEELREELASIIALDPQERAERLPSGQQGVFDNRVGWAHDSNGWATGFRRMRTNTRDERGMVGLMASSTSISWAFKRCMFKQNAGSPT